MPTTEIEVKKRPLREQDVFSRTRFPDDLLLYFRGIQRNLRWGAANDDQQAQAQSIGFEPVIAKDLPSEILEVCKRYKIHADGTITIGDLILQSRSLFDRKRQHALEEEIRTAQESDPLPDAPEGTAGFLHPPGNPTIGESILGPREALEAGLVPDVTKAVDEILAANRAKEAAEYIHNQEE